MHKELEWHCATQRSNLNPLLRSGSLCITDTLTHRLLCPCSPVPDLWVPVTSLTHVRSLVDQVRCLVHPGNASAVQTSLSDLARLPWGPAGLQEGYCNDFSALLHLGSCLGSLYSFPPLNLYAIRMMRQLYTGCMGLCDQIQCTGSILGGSDRLRIASDDSDHP
jgi:hypothetical protein